MNGLKSTLFFLAFLFCPMCCPVLAQSTLVNVPSTDIVAAQKVYLEADFITNYAWEREVSFQAYAARAVVGITRNVEAGVNVAYTHVSGKGQPFEVQPNIKWQFYNNEHSGTASAVGCILYAPITHRADARTLGFCYTVTSQKVNGRYGPRFTVGAYALLHATDNDRAKAGVIVGYEQPLAKKLRFLADWTSGANRFGYVSPSLSVTTSSSSALTAGYTIANHGRGSNGLFAYYGVQF
jgi:hypothetical protein